MEDFSVESTNESSLANVSSESLAISSSSKPWKISSKEKVRKMEKENQNYFRICNVKYDTKLDKDFYCPWIGCNVKPCNYWIHAFVWALLWMNPVSCLIFFAVNITQHKSHHIEELLRKHADKTFVMNRG